MYLSPVSIEQFGFIELAHPPPCLYRGELTGQLCTRALDVGGERSERASQKADWLSIAIEPVRFRLGQRRLASGIVELAEKASVHWLDRASVRRLPEALVSSPLTSPVHAPMEGP